MKRKLMLYLGGTFAMLLVAAPAFAQGGAPATGGPTVKWAEAIAVVGMALAAGLCGLGQGKATAAACEGVARNPGARPAIFLFLILGLILIESLSLYTLAIVFLKIT
jgi:F-type H+-transporting ATPase subunit c